MYVTGTLAYLIVKKSSPLKPPEPFPLYYVCGDRAPVIDFFDNVVEKDAGN